MIFGLHGLLIALDCNTEVVQSYWQRLFAGWLEPCASTRAARLQLVLVDDLPALPGGLPFFVDTDYITDGAGLLSVYQEGHEGMLLHYLDGAVVQVPIEDERPSLIGHVLPQVLNYGRLEDITFTSLAPFLRRQGYYLVHAFGVCKDGQCLLFIGSSGSGKTTTGLSLVMTGWELLANDILLIEEREDGIYALPTPGGLSIREGTLGLLPDCQQLVTDVPCVQGKYNLTNQQMWHNSVPKASRVTAVYFCQIEKGTVSEKRPLSPAITLAHLMEQSIDRWDEKMLNEHITVLQKLSQQADCFSVHLGQDVPQLPHLLTNNP